MGIHKVKFKVTIHKWATTVAIRGSDSRYIFEEYPKQFENVKNVNMILYRNQVVYPAYLRLRDGRQPIPRSISQKYNLRKRTPKQITIEVHYLTDDLYREIVIFMPYKGGTINRKWERKITTREYSLTKWIKISEAYKDEEEAMEKALKQYTPIMDDLFFRTFHWFKHVEQDLKELGLIRIGYTNRTKPYLTSEQLDKVRAMITEIPDESALPLEPGKIGREDTIARPEEEALYVRVGNKSDIEVTDKGWDIMTTDTTKYPECNYYLQLDLDFVNDIYDLKNKLMIIKRTFNITKHIYVYVTSFKYKSMNLHVVCHQTFTKNQLYAIYNYLKNYIDFKHIRYLNIKGFTVLAYDSRKLLLFKI